MASFGVVFFNSLSIQICRACQYTNLDILVGTNPSLSYLRGKFYFSLIHQRDSIKSLEGAAYTMTTPEPSALAVTSLLSVSLSRNRVRGVAPHFPFQAGVKKGVPIFTSISKTEDKRSMSSAASQA